MTGAPAEIVFRPLAAADVPAAAALWHRGWHDAHAALAPPEIFAERTPEVFREKLASIRAHARGAFVGEALAGFHVVDAEELDQFYVDAAWRGRGVAAALMVDAEATLAAAGVREAFLMCAVGNERARRFYAKAGWAEGPMVTGTMWSIAKGTVPVPCHRFTRRLGA